MLTAETNFNNFNIHISAIKTLDTKVCIIEAIVMITNILLLLISVKPEVRPVPDNGIIITETGKSVTLECEVTRGFPTPEVSWHRRERKVLYIYKSTSHPRFNYPKYK